MPGLGDNAPKAWSLTHDVIAMDDPANIGKHLGRGHEKLSTVSHDIVKASTDMFRLLLSSHSRTTYGSAGGDPSANRCRSRLHAKQEQRIRGAWGPDAT